LAVPWLLAGVVADRGRFAGDSLATALSHARPAHGYRCKTKSSARLPALLKIAVRGQSFLFARIGTNSKSTQCWCITAGSTVQIANSRRAKNSPAAVPRRLAKRLVFFGNDATLHNFFHWNAGLEQFLRLTGAPYMWPVVNMLE